MSRGGKRTALTSMGKGVNNIADGSSTGSKSMQGELTDQELAIILTCMEGARDVARSSAVSKQWYRVIGWKEAISFGPKDSNDHVVAMMKRMKCVKDISLTQVAAFKADMMHTWARSCPDLKSLTLSYVTDYTSEYVGHNDNDDGGFRVAMLASLPGCFPMLEQLHFEASDDSNAYMEICSSSRVPPFVFPHLKSLTLPPLSICNETLQLIFESCPSLQSAALTVRFSGASITHNRITSLDINFYEGRPRIPYRPSTTCLKLNTPRLTSLTVNGRLAEISGAVSPEMTKLEIRRSCDSLSLFPLPAKLSHFHIQAWFTSKLLQSVAAVIHSSSPTLETLQIQSMGQPTLDEQSDVPRAAASAAAAADADAAAGAAAAREAVFAPLKAMWNAIRGSPNLRILMIDASFLPVPKSEPLCLPSLENLVMVVWECSRFFCTKGLQMGNGWEMLTWRGLVKHVEGCPKLMLLELLVGGKVRPEQLGEICRGSMGLQGVEVLSSTYKPS